MLSAYQAPGVYHQRLDTGAPTIAAIRTDVTGFVGIAERGPPDTPVVLESWRQFRAHFGGFIPGGYLAYSVHAFFLNGGRRCWVVRIADKDAARPAVADVSAPDATTPTGLAPAWRIEAASPGVWGDALSFELMESNSAKAEIVDYADGEVSATVTTTSGFERRSLVRIRQEGGTELIKVVSGVDHVSGSLIWVHEERASRLPFDSALNGLDGSRPIFVEAIEYRMVVKADGRVVGTYDELSRVPGHARYAPTVLHAPYERAKAKGPDTVPDVPPPVVVIDVDTGWTSPVPPAPLATPATGLLSGGIDGLSTLKADHFIGEEVDPADSALVQDRKLRGLESLRVQREISALAIPDIHIRPEPARIGRSPVLCEPDPCLLDPPTPPAHPRVPTPPDIPPLFDLSDVYRVQDAMVTQAEQLKDRVAILDAPAAFASSLDEGLPGIVRWRGRFESKYAALYYPWVKVPHPVGGRGPLTRDIPPSGHVAGRYAGTDYEIGVHKAPANTALEWILDATVSIDRPTAGLLNPKGINAIRSFAGRGTRIYGARLASSDPDWRYVNVRRLLLMIRKALEFSTQWAAFEPNDAFTRAKIHLALLSFLTALWQRGALAGELPDEAFRVQCDEENNPPHERDLGKLIADVRVAPNRPFEFVVVRVGRTESDFEVSEMSEVA